LEVISLKTIEYKEIDALKVCNVTLKGIVNHRENIPYLESIKKVRELRKEDKKINFPSNILSAQKKK